VQTNPKPKQNPLLILGVVGVVAVLATLAVLSLASRPGPAASGGPQLVREDSPRYGNPGAKVVLVEFLDPECEACAAVHPLVGELKRKYREQMQLVVRYLPLHANSVLAASAMEAAGEQGKYWEYADLIYRGQPDWAPPHDGGPPKIAPREAFVQYAGFLGLDRAAFERSLDDPKHARKVERDRQDAQRAGATGTPTFFLNGDRLSVRSRADLESAIARAVQAAQ
jgi:protein-disulfide isomerase